MRPAINLGDLAAALRAIGPQDAADAALLADALGYSIVRERRPSRPLPGPAPGHERPARPAQRPPAVAPDEELPLLPAEEAPRSPAGPGWSVDAPVLEPFDEAVHLAAIAEHEPLLDPRTSRQLLAHALATLRPYGELELDTAVEIVASGGALDPLPLRTRRSLARGAQVLVDTGAGMAPFARDAWEVVVSVERLVGHAQTEVAMFDSVLSRGCGAGAIWDWGAYAPPLPGVPVLVLTDLGLSLPLGALTAPERVAEWLDVAAKLAAVHCPLVLLVPYPSRRWPAALADAVVLVEWDRTTTVGQVHALRRRLEAWR